MMKCCSGEVMEARRGVMEVRGRLCGDDGVGLGSTSWLTTCGAAGRVGPGERTRGVSRDL
jgi:hypothetical protein